MDRNDYSKELTDDSSYFNAIDLGSRDGELLKKISCNNRYGVDLHNSFEDEGIVFVKHNLEQGMPKIVSKYDLIIANDLLEHIENKNMLIDEMFECCDGRIIISLPNTMHWFYLYGLLRGSMGKQYDFMVEDGSDRHRWVTYYKANILWIEKSARRGGFKISGYREAVVKKGIWKYIFVPKRFCVFNQIFMLQKIDV